MTSFFNGLERLREQLEKEEILMLLQDSNYCTLERQFKNKKVKCDDVFSYFFRSTKNDRGFHLKD
jgi:hypothetical protein